MKRFFAMKKTLIVANGEKPSPSLLKRYASFAEMIIATDGALDFLLDEGVKPHIVVGDMDSIKNAHHDDIVMVKIADQNSNDLEKALSYCSDHDRLDITVLGAFGLRADHFLTNLYVMNKFSTRLNVTFVDEEQCAFICPKNTTLFLEKAVGKFISLFPMGDRVGPITSTGVEYPLTKECLTLHTRLGTLNRVVNNRATIFCASDNLLVVTAGEPLSS